MLSSCKPCRSQACPVKIRSQEFSVFSGFYSAASREAFKGCSFCLAQWNHNWPCLPNHNFGSVSTEVKGKLSANNHAQLAVGADPHCLARLSFQKPRQPCWPLNRATLGIWKRHFFVFVVLVFRSYVFGKQYEDH